MGPGAVGCWSWELEDAGGATCLRLYVEAVKLRKDEGQAGYRQVCPRLVIDYRPPFTAQRFLKRLSSGAAHTELAWEKRATAGTVGH